MKSICIKSGLGLFIGVFISITACSGVFAREVTDMLGRRVTIPDEITRIYSGSPPGYAFLYSLAPELLCGRAMRSNSPFERRLLRDDVAELPLIGSFGGQSIPLNVEALLKAKPDLMIEVTMVKPQNAPDALHARTNETLERLGIPYIYVYAGDITAYPEAYAFLGEILGKKERARELGDYISGALADAARIVAAVPPEQRPKVYYAEGMDGLSTESSDTFHAHLLKLAGEVNVHRHSLSAVDPGGFERISLEHVLAYDPDYILALEKSFFTTVYKNEGWQKLKAVQNKNVLWIPRGPFNWFDRPPSFMRGLGLKWLLAGIYPEHYQIDLRAETRYFYRTFLWADLTDDEIEDLLYPKP